MRPMRLLSALLMTLACSAALAAGPAPKKPRSVAEVKRWSGSFTLVVAYEDSLKANNGVVITQKHHLSATGSFTLEPAEDEGEITEYGGLWRGEAQDFTLTGTITDITDAAGKAKYVVTTTVGPLVDNQNYAALSVYGGKYTLHVGVEQFKGLRKFDGPPELDAFKGKQDELGLQQFLDALVQDAKRKIEEPTTVGIMFSTPQDQVLPPDFSISGSSKVELNLSSVRAKNVEGQMTWKLAPDMDAPYIEVIREAVDQPHCVCTPETIAEFTAKATPGGGEFQAFEIETDKGAPTVLSNTGGRKPFLQLKGAGRSTGLAKIRAVYKKDNRVFKSRPFELHFCELAKVELARTPNNYIDDSKEYFVWEDSRPGTLDITAYVKGAWLDGEERQPEWTIEPNDEGLTQETLEEGKRVKFKGNALPKDNDGFGKREIKAEVNDACQCSDTKTVTVLFPRDAKNNPEGKEPNWSYYWRRTSAGRVANGQYQIVAQLPPMDGTPLAAKILNCLPNWGGEAFVPHNVFARYDFMKDKIFFREKFFDMPCLERGPGQATTDIGIDCYAVVLRHEAKHREELTSWWGKGLANYACLEDRDGDLVPTVVEDATPGCDAGEAKSCPGRPTWKSADITDIELDAYEAGWSWDTGSADGEDWACPGKNAPGEYRY